MPCAQSAVRISPHCSCLCEPRCLNTERLIGALVVFTLASPDASKQVQLITRVKTTTMVSQAKSYHTAFGGFQQQFNLLDETIWTRK